ncbi:MAG TPA: hypothetical protein VLE95_04285 [Chlamydiales bacterium]|nr:hypothetical protein [Chlamydiales bacterium]
MTIPFEIATIVWGEQYTKLFLDYLVPNYLSENNIPLASRRYAISSTIYTRPEDAEQIASHPHYRKLREFIDGEIVPLIDQKVLAPNNKYHAKGYCQSVAIKRAIESKKVILLLNPDSLISDGGLTKCCSLIAEGKKAVLVGELARTEIESVLPHLAPFYNPQSYALTLPNRKLVELGVKHLHYVAKILFWHGEIFSQWPSIVYWRAGTNSLLAKFFHLHPLAIDLRNIRRKLPAILMPDDGGLIEFLGIRPEEIHPVTDSEEIACVELTSKTLFLENSMNYDAKKKPRGLLNFSFRYALPSHIDQFLHLNLRFQGDDAVNWSERERLAADDLGVLTSVLSVIKTVNQIKKTGIKILRFTAILLGMRYIKRLIAKRKK